MLYNMFCSEHMSYMSYNNMTCYTPISIKVTSENNDT